MIVRAPKAVASTSVRYISVRGGVQGLAQHQAGKQRIDQDGAVAVVPVEGQQAALAGPEPLGGAGQVAVRIAVRPYVRRGPGTSRTS